MSVSRSLAALVAAAALSVAQAQPDESELSPFELQRGFINGDFGRGLERVTKGQLAPTRAYPWLVSIGVAGQPHSLGHFCGGAAIDNFWVLTAAHCLEGAAAADIQIQFGSNKLTGEAGGTIILATEIVRHMGYHKKPDANQTGSDVPVNDLALIKLAESVNVQILPMLAPAQSTLLDDERNILVAGWGRLAEDEPTSNDLMHVSVKIVAAADCNGPESYNGDIDQTMFCAGDAGKDTCEGDSGGPAMLWIPDARSDQRILLGGVVSWGDGCGRDDKPGVYVRVPNFYVWVNDIVSNDDEIVALNQPQYLENN